MKKDLFLAFLPTNLLATCVIRKLKDADFNDQRDFELTEIKISKFLPEVVMFILVCSIAGFNVSTVKCNTLA